MKIVVPMSGFGERFRRAGYDVPKPLIHVEGKPIVAHVVEMFPGESDFIFICNEEHLARPEYAMRETLEQSCPTGAIVAVAPHKLGPVHAVQQAKHLIDPEEQVIVNYCDFTCYWDWPEFKHFLDSSQCDGAIPAYRGFHPHSLGSTNYAYMRESEGWVYGIQEKQPYTTDRMAEFASSGTYYFATAAMMFDAFERMKKQELSLNGEYYASLAYRPLLDDGRRIAVYELQHFMQWGTPEDVSEYNMWSGAFRELAAQPHAKETPSGSQVLLLAGLGQRFVDAGYEVPKPLIKVSGRPMVEQATGDLPAVLHRVFVLRGDMPEHEKLVGTLQACFPGSEICLLPGVTEGQACSALEGLDTLLVRGQAIGPITVGACDFGVLYDRAALERLMRDPDVDVIVWGIRGVPNAIRRPEAYGWIAETEGRVHGVAVKAPLNDPGSDPIILGTFTFKDASLLKRIVTTTIAQNRRVNGEFYLDSAIWDALDLGLEVRYFEVDHALPWGTPDELRTFEYWQSCFHKWVSHPYRLERDAHVPLDAVEELATLYSDFSPYRPA